MNGSTVSSAQFAGTGSWESWTTATIAVPLNAGGNTVRLTATTANGLANIDYIEVETDGGDTTPPDDADALYVSPNGSDGASGTESDPTTLTSAIGRISSGGTIYMRGGTYRYSQTVTIPQGSNGSSGARTQLSAYPARPPSSTSRP